jgi:hypothetical protein
MIFSQKFDTEEEGLDWMDETFFQLNDAVVHSQLPSMIKDRVGGIAVVLTTLMGVYLLGMGEDDQPVHFWEVWIKELWDAFKSRKNVGKEEVAANLLLQEFMNIREAVFKFTYRELSTISERNANILKETFDYVHRGGHGKLIMGQICNFFFFLSQHQLISRFNC